YVSILYPAMQVILYSFILFFFISRFTLFSYSTLFRSAWAPQRPGDADGRRPSARRQPSPRRPPAGSGGLASGGGSPVHPEGGKRSEEHTSELQSREKIVCRLLLEKNNTIYYNVIK